jgi:hypothetical protein
MQFATATFSTTTYIFDYQQKQIEKIPIAKAIKFETINKCIVNLALLIKTKTINKAVRKIRVIKKDW